MTGANFIPSMLDRAPQFVRDADIRPLDEELLQGIMSNWMKLHAYLTSNKANITTVHLAIMIRYEIENEARWNIVERLYGKYNVQRMREERAMLKAITR